MSPFYPSLPMQRDYVNPLAAGITGLGAGMEIGNQALKQRMYGEALGEQQEKRRALQEFAQTRDPNALIGVDPELGMKVKTWLDAQPPENLRDITRATDYVQKIGPSINSKTWPSILPELQKAFPNLPKDALPPANADDTTLFKYANAAKLLDLQLKKLDPNVQLKERELEEVKIPKLTIEAQHKQAQQRHWATTEGINLEKLKHDKTTIKELADPKNPGGPPKMFLLNAQTGDIIKEIGDKGGQATPETVDFLARVGLYGGFRALPTMGFGPQIRGPVLNKMAELALKENITPEDVMTRGVVRDALQSGFRQMEGLAGKIESFSRSFDKNIDALKAQSPKLHRTGVPTVNAWINAGKRAVTGDPELSAFDVYVKTIANDYARIVSTVTGGGVTAEAEIKKAEALVSAAQTPQQLMSALKAMETDTKNRITSFEDQRNVYKDRIADLGKKPSGAGAKEGGGMWGAPPPKAGNVGSYVGPGKYNGKVITSQEEFNREFGG